MAITNYLSIDVEDYFQVSAFEGISPPETWSSCELRVEDNTEKILDILTEANVLATFFVLGWVAHYCPALVKRIAREGHEIASHGYGHQRVNLQNRSQFREDVRRSKALLEDLCGQRVLGYRAPSYSIGLNTLWAFDELREAGYLYDSSVFPVKHDLYGIDHWPRYPFCVVRDVRSDWRPEDATAKFQECRFQEIPITTLRLCGRNVPIAGGGYFRLFPYALTRWGLNRINRHEGQPFVFYLHPWELDPGQPRMQGAGLKSRVRHYLNLKKTEERFRKLLKDFSFAPIREALAGQQREPVSAVMPAAAIPAKVRVGHAHTSG